MTNKINEFIKEKKVLDVFLKENKREIRGKEKDIEKDYNDFEKWMDLNMEPSIYQSNIVALYFGLFETEENIKIYVAGSEEWDEDDEDWASNEDFAFKERYIDLPVFAQLKKTMESNLEEGCYLTLCVLITYITTYFKNNLIKQKIKVATGFDDGDLFHIELIN